MRIRATRAPLAGNVVRRNLAAMVGTYLDEGDEVVSIGDESKKELLLSVAQDDIDLFSKQVAELVCIDVPRRALWTSQLEKVIPRATRTPTHPALTATNGGPLPVRPIGRHASTSQSQTHELLTPRFTAVVAVDCRQAGRLRAGQRATVTYRPLNQSIGQYLFRMASGWLHKRLASLAER